MAGAAHLLNDNTGVLRLALCGLKARVEYKGKSQRDDAIVSGRNPGLEIPLRLVRRAGGDRKVTTGITGLWRPSVHSDVAF